MKRNIIAGITGTISFVIGFILGGKILVSTVNDYKKRMERNLSNMVLLNDWLELLYSGGNIEQYFNCKGYKKIMIYGNGYVGRRLTQALTDSDIEVAAIMDKSVTADQNGIVIGADSEIPNVDCIVITPVYYYDEILGLLREKTNVPLVSMKTVIDFVSNER